MNELTLQEPEIVKQGSRFGVRLKANAPSLCTSIRVDIETEVSPVVGTEKQSEELVKYLLEEFQNDPQTIWNTNFFGKSLHELVREGLAQQADAHARGRSGKSAGDPQQDHQRRQRRHDLHPPLTRGSAP